MSEKVIENLILKYLAYCRIFAWKNNSTGVYDPTKKTFRANKNPYAIKGVADILGVLPDGKLLAIEVKMPKGRVSKEQKQFIERVNDNGGIAFVARGLREIQNHLEEYINESGAKEIPE